MWVEGVRKKKVARDQLNQQEGLELSPCNENKSTEALCEVGPPPTSSIAKATRCPPGPGPHLHLLGIEKEEVTKGRSHPLSTPWLLRDPRASLQGRLGNVVLTLGEQVPG